MPATARRASRTLNSDSFQGPDQLKSAWLKSAPTLSMLRLAFRRNHWAYAGLLAATSTARVKQESLDGIHPYAFERTGGKDRSTKGREPEAARCYMESQAFWVRWAWF